MVAIAVVLAAIIGAMRVVDRFLDHDDSRACEVEPWNRRASI
jgi:hypothetical protein